MVRSDSSHCEVLGSNPASCICEFLLPHMRELCLFSSHVSSITLHVWVVFISPCMCEFPTPRMCELLCLYPRICEFPPPLMCEFPSPHMCELCHESQCPSPFARLPKKNNNNNIIHCLLHADISYIAWKIFWQLYLRPLNLDWLEALYMQESTMDYYVSIPFYFIIDQILNDVTFFFRNLFNWGVLDCI